MLVGQQQKNLKEEVSNIKQLQKTEVMVDLLQKKYGCIDVYPKHKFGHLSQMNFNSFIEKCLPEYSRALTMGQMTTVYKEFSKLIPQEEDQPNMEEYCTPTLVADTDGTMADGEIKNKNTKYDSHFSLRTFVVTALMMSPMTVKEKLDILFDVVDSCNPRVDGIDI